jgi:hypothetical protein
MVVQRVRNLVYPQGLSIRPMSVTDYDTIPKIPTDCRCQSRTSLETTPGGKLTKYILLGCCESA